MKKIIGVWSVVSILQLLCACGKSDVPSSLGTVEPEEDTLSSQLADEFVNEGVYDGGVLAIDRINGICDEVYSGLINELCQDGGGYIQQLFNVCGNSKAFISSEEYREPQDVALSFLKAEECGDVDELERSISFENRADESCYKAYLKRVKNLKGRGNYGMPVATGFVVQSTEVNGNKACVKLNGKNAFDKDRTVELQLLKVDGYWRVDGSSAVLHRMK